MIPLKKFSKSFAVRFKFFRFVAKIIQDVLK